MVNQEVQPSETKTETARGGGAAERTEHRLKFELFKVVKFQEYEWDSMISEGKEEGINSTAGGFFTAKMSNLFGKRKSRLKS